MRSGFGALISFFAHNHQLWTFHLLSNAQPYMALELAAHWAIPLSIRTLQHTSTGRDNGSDQPRLGHEMIPVLST